MAFAYTLSDGNYEVFRIARGLYQIALDQQSIEKQVLPGVWLLALRHMTNDTPVLSQQSTTVS